MFSNSVGRFGQKPIRKLLEPQRPVGEIYVAIDNCAQLGGQPYKVLESLKKVYEITGKRNIYFVDTSQGFYEKSNCTIPDFVFELNRPRDSYVGFLQRNPEDIKIIDTPVCAKFREDMATKVIPSIVLPIMNLSEETSRKIQEEAFKIMEERGINVIDGKQIGSPSDIEIRIEENQDTKNLYFSGELINKAVEAIIPYWREEIEKISSLKSKSSITSPDFMAEMIKSTQEVKALTYAFVNAYSPRELSEIKNLPHIESNISLNSVAPDNLRKLLKQSYSFSATSLRDDKDWWQKPEAIQALRLTKLWPWLLQQNLSETAINKLRNCHENIADNSYLYLYTDILSDEDTLQKYIPESNPLEKKLFIIVTNDGPLVTQFLEVSTGVSERPDKKQNNGKHTNKGFTLSGIYDELNLTRRNPADYVHQSAWVGSEFVRFVYTEILNSIGAYVELDEERKESLLTTIKYNQIEKDKIGNSYSYLKELLKNVKCNNPESNVDDPQKKVGYITQELKDALTDLLEKAHAMEYFISDDIRTKGNVITEGRYGRLQASRLRQRSKLEPSSRGVG